MVAKAGGRRQREKGEDKQRQVKWHVVVASRSIVRLKSSSLDASERIGIRARTSDSAQGVSCHLERERERELVARVRVEQEKKVRPSARETFPQQHKKTTQVID